MRRAICRSGIAPRVAKSCVKWKAMALRPRALAPHTEGMPHDLAPHTEGMK